jgi:hypothetical protein
MGVSGSTEMVLKSRLGPSVSILLKIRVAMAASRCFFESLPQGLLH